MLVDGPCASAPQLLRHAGDGWADDELDVDLSISGFTDLTDCSDAVSQSRGDVSVLAYNSMYVHRAYT